MLPKLTKLSAVIGLTLSTLAWPAQAEQTLFRFKGFDYRASELSPTLQQELFKAEQDHYQRLQQIADSALVERYFAEQAESGGKNLEDLMQTELGATPPSDEVVREFYEQNKAKLKLPDDFEKIKPRIALHLQTQAMEANKIALLAKLKQDPGYKLLLARPQAPYVEIDTLGYPVKGQPDAPVTVVEFADYQCPHCKKSVPVIDQLLRDYAGKVRLVYMDMPINASGVSRSVAEGAQCAAKLGKFWEYHDLAFANQSQLEPNSPADLAKQLGLDSAAFNVCLSDPATAAKVAASKAEAERVGVDATPGIFVNGKRVLLYDLEQDIKAAIDAALAAQP